MGPVYETLPPGSKWERVPLFPGIELSYLDLTADFFTLRHEALAHIIQIDYCRAGQMAWETGLGGSLCLDPGDYLIHTVKSGMDSAIRFPTGRYQGLMISIDLREAAARPPEWIGEAGLFDSLLKKRFCRDHALSLLPGSEQSEAIFAGFYDRPEGLRLAYQRVKVLELLLYLAQAEPAPQTRLAEYPAEQIALVREIHDRFLQHIGQRVTIEELSRQYHVNPTTLKEVFKAVYGSSLAAHIKKHRMEQAARLLRETDLTIAEIAQAVGYDSQSKFTSAFKNQFALLPTAYRKQYSSGPGRA